MNKLKEVKFFGVELVFDENSKLIPQKISKSLLAALYFKSQESFRAEILKIMEGLSTNILQNHNENDNTYQILQLSMGKKTYSKQVCEIILHYFGDILHEEIEVKYKEIKHKYYKSIKKYRKNG